MEGAVKEDSQVIYLQAHKGQTVEELRLLLIAILTLLPDEQIRQIGPVVKMAAGQAGVELPPPTSLGDALAPGQL